MPCCNLGLASLCHRPQSPLSDGQLTVLYRTEGKESTGRIHDSQGAAAGYILTGTSCTNSGALILPLRKVQPCLYLIRGLSAVYCQQRSCCQTQPSCDRSLLYGELLGRGSALAAHGIHLVQERLQNVEPNPSKGRQKQQCDDAKSIVTCKLGHLNMQCRWSAHGTGTVRSSSGLSITYRHAFRRLQQKDTTTDRNWRDHNLLGNRTSCAACTFPAARNVAAAALKLAARVTCAGHPPTRETRISAASVVHPFK